MKSLLRFTSLFIVSIVSGLGLSAQEAAPPAGPMLMLDDAIQLALKHNKQIEVGSFYTPIAKANVTTAYGQFDPSINFNRSYSENNAPYSANPPTLEMIQTNDYGLNLAGSTPWGLSYAIGATALHQYNTYGNLRLDYGYSTFAGVSVTQPLLRGFGFGANLIGLRLAKADRAIADWQFRGIVIDTITQVKDAYYSLTLAHQVLRITELSQDRAAGLFSENEKRFKVGNISENDMIQARAQVAIRAEAIIVARQQLRDAENVLRQLVGEENFPLDGTFYSLQELPPAEEKVTPAEDLKKAYDLRPDYQAMKLGLVKNHAQLSYARNQLLPQLNFVGSYGYDGIDQNFAASRRMVGDRDNRAYTAGLVVSVPLTFASGRGQARAARLQLQQAESNLGALAQQIAVNITSAAGQIETTRQRVAANRAAYELQKQVLDGQVKLLRAGSGSTYNVLQYQEQLASVERSLANAITAQRVAAANYDRETGRTLDRNHITLEK